MAKIEVGVTVVQRDGKLLTVYNQKWGAFTLPMTKRRSWGHPDDPKMIRPEDWRDTAIRNLVECFGRTYTEEPDILFEVSDFHQSDRDQKVKDYHFHVFGAVTVGDAPLIAGVLGEWLTPDEILDPSRRPMSSTARYLVKELNRRSKV